MEGAESQPCSCVVSLSQPGKAGICPGMLNVSCEQVLKVTVASDLGSVPCHRPAGGQLCEQRGTCPTWSWRLHVSCSSCQDHCELLPLTWWPPSLPPCWPHSLPLDLCTGCSFCYFGVGFYEPVNCHTGLFVADSWPCAHSTKDLTSKLT